MRAYLGTVCFWGWELVRNSPVFMDVWFFLTKAQVVGRGLSILHSLSDYNMIPEAEASTKDFFRTTSSFFWKHWKVLSSSCKGQFRRNVHGLLRRRIVCSFRYWKREVGTSGRNYRQNEGQCSHPRYPWQLHMWKEDSVWTVGRPAALYLYSGWLVYLMERKLFQSSIVYAEESNALPPYYRAVHEKVSLTNSSSQRNPHLRTSWSRKLHCALLSMYGQTYICTFLPEKVRRLSRMPWRWESSVFFQML